MLASLFAEKSAVSNWIGNLVVVQNYNGIVYSERFQFKSIVFMSGFLLLLSMGKEGSG